MTEQTMIGSGGLPLAVCHWGGADGRATLILHGFLEQGAAWDAVATRLNRRVYAPDHRGHGRSGHVGVGGFYHFWDYVADVDAIVDQLGPVDLVGHSMGGTIACLFAGTRPESVRRLVLVEGLGPPDASDGAVERARQFLDHRRDPPAHGALRDVDEGVRRTRKYNPNIPEHVARAMVERTVIPREGGFVWAWDALHRARSPTAFQRTQFDQFLRAIRAPVLRIDGADSPWILPDAEERAALLQDSQRIAIAGAGHLVHHDKPDELAAAIAAFFDA
jgi:pimeloyl-ACP methyl ester carboxylesterase